MRKSLKRVLASVLSAALLVSAMSMTALAAPGEGPGGGGPGGPGKAQAEDSGRIPACIARRPKKDPPRTDKEKLHWQWSLTQPVQASVSWPVPYDTLDDENSYAPGHNDPFKNLEQNQARFMG